MTHAPHSEARPWCAVAASRDVPALAVIPVVLADVPLAVWRSAEGQIQAWHDRCPHRGMRLSLGGVSPRGLVCPYHGWRFGNDAQCNFIPAHPASVPPAAARVRPYPVVERHGYIWVARQDTPGEPPSLPDGLDPVRSMHMPLDGARLAQTWLRSCLHATGRVTAFDAGAAAAGFESRADEDGMVLHGCWRNGDGVDYVGLIQPAGRDTSMLHLAGVGALSGDARRGLNQALVALRRTLVQPIAPDFDWRTTHECV